MKYFLLTITKSCHDELADTENAFQLTGEVAVLVQRAEITKVEETQSSPQLLVKMLKYSTSSTRD